MYRIPVIGCRYRISRSVGFTQRKGCARRDIFKFCALVILQSKVSCLCLSGSILIAVSELKTLQDISQSAGHILCDGDVLGCGDVSGIENCIFRNCLGLPVNRGYAVFFLIPAVKGINHSIYRFCRRTFFIIWALQLRRKIPCFNTPAVIYRIHEVKAVRSCVLKPELYCVHILFIQGHHAVQMVGIGTGGNHWIFAVISRICSAGNNDPQPVDRIVPLLILLCFRPCIAVLFSIHPDVWITVCRIIYDSITISVTVIHYQIYRIAGRTSKSRNTSDSHTVPDLIGIRAGAFLFTRDQRIYVQIIFSVITLGRQNFDGVGFASPAPIPIKPPFVLEGMCNLDCSFRYSFYINTTAICRF